MNRPLIETMQIVNLLPPKDINSAAFAAAYIDMKYFSNLTIVLPGGSNANSSASIDVTVTQATDTSGTSAAALAIQKYYKTNGTTDAKTATSVSSSGNTFSLVASTNNILYQIDFRAGQLTDGKTCVGVAVAATAAATLLGGIAILSGTRYPAQVGNMQSAN